MHARRPSRPGAQTACGRRTTSPRSGRSSRTTRRPDGSAAHAPRLLRARARGGLRPRPHPPARAHAPGPEGGPAAPDARHARPTSPPSSASSPTRGERARQPSRTPPPASRSPRPTRRHARTPLAGQRPRRGRGLQAALADGRAADRRRPPPLRDRARLRRGGRRRGRARYVLMFLCSLSDPGLTVFPTHRLLTDLKDDAQAGGASATRSSRTSRSSRSPAERSSPAGRRRPASRWATWTRSTSRPTA